MPIPEPLDVIARRTESTQAGLDDLREQLYARHESLTEQAHARHEIVIAQMHAMKEELLRELQSIPGKVEEKSVNREVYDAHRDTLVKDVAANAEDVEALDKRVDKVETRQTTAAAVLTAAGTLAAVFHDELGKILSSIKI